MSSLSAAVVLGLQSDDKATMLVVNTINNVLKNLHENGFQFPEEILNKSVRDHQHDRCDITCKPAMQVI